MLRLAKIGYAKGIQQCLDNIEAEATLPAEQFRSLRELANRFQFSALTRLLEGEST